MTWSDWATPQDGPAPQPPEAPRGRSSALRVLVVVLNLVLFAGAGVLIGHAVWRTSTTPAAAPAPSPSSGNTGNSGNAGFAPGSGGSNFGSPSTGSSGAASSGAGGPSDAAAIAARVDSGLVDIDTTLSYEDEEAAGTGMVLTSNGEILTNNHVIEEATAIRVTDVGNGKSYGATVVGYDRDGDVAVLQLEGASGLTTVSLGSSADLSKGEEVVGIGNAGGSGGTPSYAGGSVTALAQSITASDEGDGTSEQLTGLIETDADIQPGDSGGPLVNTSGKVIGMDTAALAGFSFAQSSSSTSAGYSIPIDTALGIAREITAGSASSTVHVGATAFLGVDVTSPSTGGGGFGGYGQSAPAPTATGAEIETVIAGSPAAAAGLSEGDTITALAGQSVSSPESLTSIIEGLKPGASVTVSYLDASGSQQSSTVQLASGPPQ